MFYDVDVFQYLLENTCWEGLTQQRARKSSKGDSSVLHRASFLRIKNLISKMEALEGKGKCCFAGRKNWNAEELFRNASHYCVLVLLFLAIFRHLKSFTCYVSILKIWGHQYRHGYWCSSEHTQLQIRHQYPAVFRNVFANFKRGLFVQRPDSERSPTWSVSKPCGIHLISLVSI